MNKSFSAGMLVSLAWLATVANAFGQAQTWKPTPNEPLEKYDNPPALIYRPIVLMVDIIVDSHRCAKD